MSNKKPYRLTRQIECFKKQGDESLVFEESLDMLSVEEIKKLLEIGGEDDPKLLYDYFIPDEKIISLQKLLRHKIDSSKYQYFYSCSAQYIDEK